MRYVVVLALAVWLVLAAGVVSAHPPDEVRIEFDNAGHVLTVSVQHGSKDAAKHYVNKITVELDGKKIIEQKFESQVSGGRQEATYKMIDAEPGNRVKVTAGCSISGKKTATIRVPALKSAEEVKKETKKGN